MRSCLSKWMWRFRMFIRLSRWRGRPLKGCWEKTGFLFSCLNDDGGTCGIVRLDVCPALCTGVSMHQPRPQPPQPPPLSAHGGLIQTFSLKPPAALDAGKQWCYLNHLNFTEGDFGTNVEWIETACKDLGVISSFAAVCDCLYCTVSICFIQLVD